MIGFEAYIDAVTEVELAAMNMDRSGPADFDELRRLRSRLTELKNEALEREAEGVLTGDDQMSSFLTHVSDVRNYLDSLLSREPLPPAPVGVRRRIAIVKPHRLRSADDPRVA